MSIPNLISLFRLLSAFVIVYLIFSDAFVYAFWLFCLAAFSDFVDGFLARYLKSLSTLGAYLDPLADKVLLSFVFIALSIHGQIPLWLAFLVVFRDVLILAGVAALRIAQKPLPIQPTGASKLNTLLQMVLVLIHLYPGFSYLEVRTWLEYGVALTTLFSAAQYVGIWVVLTATLPEQSSSASFPLHRRTVPRSKRKIAQQTEDPYIEEPPRGKDT